MNLTELKSMIVALNIATIEFEKEKKTKTSNERNIIIKAKKFYRNVRTYMDGVKPASFQLVADGTGKPPPQTRNIEPEENEDEGVVLASNSETKEGKKKQRKKRGPNKRTRKTKK